MGAFAGGNEQVMGDTKTVLPAQRQVPIECVVQLLLKIQLLRISHQCTQRFWSQISLCWTLC